MPQNTDEIVLIVLSPRYIHKTPFVHSPFGFGPFQSSSVFLGMIRNLGTDAGRETSFFPICGQRVILVLWLIKLIFAWMCLFLSSLHIFNELNILYHWLHHTENVQISTIEVQPREIPTNIYLWILWETGGSYISFYKLHWSDKNPPPEKSFHTKCLSLLRKVLLPFAVVIH